jgi:hypothetical protein
MARRDKETLIWLISLILRRVRASTDSVELDGLCAFAIRGKGGRQGRVPVIFFEVLKKCITFLPVGRLYIGSGWQGESLVRVSMAMFAVDIGRVWGADICYWGPFWYNMTVRLRHSAASDLGEERPATRTGLVV